MSREDAFRVEGRVIEMASSRVCQVELSNGHRLLAYGVGKTGSLVAGLAPGDRVTVEISPYDLSKARIVSK